MDETLGGPFDGVNGCDMAAPGVCGVCGICKMEKPVLVEQLVQRQYEHARQLSAGAWRTRKFDTFTRINMCVASSWKTFRSSNIQCYYDTLWSRLAQEASANSIKHNVLSTCAAIWYPNRHTFAQPQPKHRPIHRWTSIATTVLIRIATSVNGPTLSLGIS